MKQDKQSAPYWRVSLANLCRMLSGLRQEAWDGEEEEEEEEGGELREGSLQLLEELYNLQHICRVLKSREERVRRAHDHYMKLLTDLLLKNVLHLEIQNEAINFIEQPVLSWLSWLSSV